MTTSIAQQNGPVITTRFCLSNQIVRIEFDPKGNIFNTHSPERRNSESVYDLGKWLPWKEEDQTNGESQNDLWFTSDRKCLCLSLSMDFNFDTALDLGAVFRMYKWKN